MNLILFRGRPGTGKTFLSGLLSAHVHAPVIRKDDIYDSMTHLNTDHQSKNIAAYNILYALLKSNLQIQTNLILDFPFQFPADIEKLRKWCFENKVNLKSIVVICSDETLWSSRFNKRAANPLPNQLITRFDDLKKHYTHLQLSADAFELLIDTVDSPEQNIKNIDSFLTQI